MTAPLTAEDLARLREIAEKATPGPWSDFDSKCYPSDPDDGDAYVFATDKKGCVDQIAQYMLDADARFVAAFDPTAVLALISQVEQLTKERDEARKELAECRTQARWLSDEIEERRRRATWLSDEIEKHEDRADTLEKEVERLRGALDSVLKEVHDIQAAEGWNWNSLSTPDWFVEAAAVSCGAALSKELPLTCSFSTSSRSSTSRAATR